MIDTHCHLTHEDFAADLDAVLARARAAGVTRCLTIGTGVADAEAALALAARCGGFVACAAGLDPFTAHSLGAAFDDALRALAELLRSGGFCALGEVGLDYHYDLAPRPVQRAQLAAQLALAAESNLPVVIHVRDAHEDLAQVLGDFPQVRGVIHSFTGGPADAERYLALGWQLAFNGIVTFNSAAAIRAALAIVPAERLLVETDSPYLAPVPLRGKRCEPAFVAHTLAKIAALRQAPLANLITQTTANAHRLFAWAEA